MKDITRLLKEYGTQNKSHSKRTFFEHLVETGGLLKNWGCSNDLCLAGYFHSFYGTEGYISQPILKFAERHQLRSEIGERAEYLVYLYCISKRRFYYNQLEKKDKFLIIIDRFTYQQISISKQTLIDLITLDIANLIEECDYQPILRWGQQPLLGFVARFGLKKIFFRGHLKGLKYPPKEAQNMLEMKFKFNLNQC